MGSNNSQSKTAWFVFGVIVSLFTCSSIPGDLSAADTGEKVGKAKTTESAAKISEKKATEIALKKVPGKVTSVEIEKKGGKNVYVVEIIETGSGAEVDVLVDMMTGKVLGTER
jgi:uncharacterized membrane protein YkoI